MELPKDEQKADIGGFPSELSMLIFGPPKIGKTTFGASAPGSLLIECEPNGARYVSGKVINVSSLDELRAVFKLLKTTPDYCQTIVIDTLDRIAMWVEDEVCAELGLKNIMDAKKGAQHGAQWAEYSSRILLQLEAWKVLKKNIIFLAHTKKAEIDGDGLVINPKTISLYGQTANRVLSIVENVGHMYARKADTGGTERVLSFAPGVAVEAGARHPLLADRVVVIDRADPFQSFSALFGEKSGPAANGEKKQLAGKKSKKEVS